MQIFDAIITISFVGSMITIMLFLLKKLTLKLFGTHVQYYLYLCAILIFIVPISVNFHAGEYSHASYADNNDGNAIQMHSYMIAADKDYQSQAVFDTHTVTHFKDYLLYIWLLGTVIACCLRIVKYARFVFELKKTSTLMPEKAFFGARIYSNEHISSPMMVGLFKTKLYIPNGDLASDEYENIMLHEGIHYKRHDLQIKWIIMLISSVHWFNPFVYLLRKEIDRYCEISCDVLATKNMDEIERTGYMNTILNLMQNKNYNISPMTTHMASPRDYIIERFKFIKSNAKSSVIMRISGGLLIVVLLCGGLLCSGVINYRNIKDNLLFFEFGKKHVHNIENISVKESREGLVEKKFDKIEPQEYVLVPEYEGTEEFYSNEVESEEDTSYVLEKIKSEEVAEVDAYPMDGIGFDEGVTMQDVVNTLNANGKEELLSIGADLKNGYVKESVSYTENLEKNIKNLKSDSNGNITVMFDVSDVVYFDIGFYEPESNLELAGYGVLSEKGRAYTFMGFEPDKTYDMFVRGATRDAWEVTGDFIVY